MFEAEFFDIFGIGVFIILLYIGVRLKKKKRAKSWVSTLIIIIAIVGLLVDLYTVFKNYVF